MVAEGGQCSTKVCRYRPIEEEFNSPVLPEMQKYLTDEEYSVAVGFYILLRAVDRFAANYNTFPGQFDGAMDEEISRLKSTAVSLLNDLGCNGSTLTEDLINEMCRYGAAELHVVAAYVGGVASQEIIKCLTGWSWVVQTQEARLSVQASDKLSLSWTPFWHFSDVVKGNGRLIPQAVKSWVEQYEKEPKPAMVELLLQESCTDDSGSLVVYSVVDVEAVKLTCELLSDM